MTCLCHANMDAPKSRARSSGFIVLHSEELNSGLEKLISVGPSMGWVRLLCFALLTGRNYTPACLGHRRSPSTPARPLRNRCGAKNSRRALGEGLEEQHQV